MALHEQSVGATDEWFTPRYIFEALGIDVDVASPGQELTPWIPAERFITRNSLSVPWEPPGLDECTVRAAQRDRAVVGTVL
jgi:hypothetical protein